MGVTASLNSLQLVGRPQCKARAGRQKKIRALAGRNSPLSQRDERTRVRPGTIQKTTLRPMIRQSFWLVLIATVVGCGQSTDPEKCRSALLQTDQEFARYSVENGPAEAFQAYLTESAIQLPNGADPIFGRDDVVAAFASGPEFDLDWDPQHAEVASACDMGWTCGTYEATFQDSTGAQVVSAGKYLNVWRKMPDGAWRVVVDMGNQP